MPKKFGKINALYRQRRKDKKNKKLKK